MSSYYQHFNAHQQHTAPSNVQSGTVHNRSRRNARLPQNNHNRNQKGVKREEEAAAVIIYRRTFEYARSFDLEDDAEFCPNILTEEDMVSMNGSGSDRSSLASGSPSSSPPTTVVSPATNFAFNSNSHPFIHSGFNISPLKIHQPSATRIGRNAIPIVNPNDGGLMSSPPTSVSPTRMQQHQQQARAPVRFY
ncbi:hypothetical protein SBOR_2903 [Sclerotinia borealis F-4128]|uniref:Uncharacterized protein n=1 Tax=Sclerotinia borealis (strain F-4128) TaxID=1432307 RepID=W9CQ65_SCLBF|nr:hypothetical protein SBOR_2903 [Sclerotinia borealis F-4128]